MKRVICFSLWGDNPKYTIGAIRNAEKIHIIYPGWVGRFYCANSVPTSIVQRLRLLGSEVIEVQEGGDWSGMFWRFSAIADYDVEMMLSRDTDSRLTIREASAVDEWIRSGKRFHIMRDHPSHDAKILGGMWGARKPILSNMQKLIARYNKRDYWQVDQDFLGKVIWPRVKRSVCLHDPFFAKKPFPVERIGLEFIGKVWDESEKTVVEHEIILRQYLEVHGIRIK